MSGTEKSTGMSFEEWYSKVLNELSEVIGGVLVVDQTVRDAHARGDTPSQFANLVIYDMEADQMEWEEEEDEDEEEGPECPECNGPMEVMANDYHGADYACFYCHPALAPKSVAASPASSLDDIEF